MTLFMGLDTSAYTTSLALVDNNQSIIADERMILEVEQGERGLRQSEALFLHVKNLPFLFKRIESVCQEHKIEAFAASAYPRNEKGSYMPVFNAGLSMGRSMSSLLGVPFYQFSHQEGHIMAGLSFNQALLAKKSFMAVHFSGGTSELLEVSRDKSKESFFEITILASGLDLHAGQLVDRVGVAMGLSFPAGRQIEELALRSGASEIPLIPSSVGESGFSFSGNETRALAMLNSGYSKEDIAFSLLRSIANTLEKVIIMHAEKNGIKDILLVGGVMANSLIKDRLLKRLEHPAVGLKLYFAEPRLSSDNAVGTAIMASFTTINN